MLALTHSTESPSAKPELELSELPTPKPGPGEVLIKVHASALNRADLLQIRGLYPPPPGESEIPGLECAGVVEAIGTEVLGVSEGERVMALLAGGGHAQWVAAPVGQLIPLPEGMSFKQAAALPEAALTAWTNLVGEGKLKAGQSVLITAAASGVGTFAVQLARELGARVLVAGRNLPRLERLRSLGAEACFQLGDELPQAVRDYTGDGVDLVMEMAGGDGLGRSLRALKPQGCLVLVGLLAGQRAQLDLGEVLRRRLRIRGSVLRSRSREEKARLVANFLATAGEALGDGRLQPIVDRVLPFAQIAEAYRQLEAGGVWGKLVVEMEP